MPPARPPGELVRLSALMPSEARDFVADLGTGPPVVVRPVEKGGPDLLGPAEALLRRDVLDAPAYDVEEGREVRVAEVWLRRGPGGSLHLVGVGIGPRGLWQRLLPRGRRTAALAAGERLVPLSRIHLASRAGHAAQLASAASAVHRLDENQLAGLLSGMPVQLAAEVVSRVPARRAGRALALLHPHVRDRLARALDDTGAAGPRRARRTVGWRKNRPPARGTGR